MLKQTFKTTYQNVYSSSYHLCSRSLISLLEWLFSYLKELHDNHAKHQSVCLVFCHSQLRCHVLHCDMMGIGHRKYLRTARCIIDMFCESVILGLVTQTHPNNPNNFPPQNINFIQFSFNQLINHFPHCW